MVPATVSQRPPFVVALRYPVHDSEVELVAVHFDIGTSQLPSVRNLDFEPQLDIVHYSNVVDLSKFVTYIRQDDRPTFAVLHPDYCCFDQENQSVKARTSQRLRNVAIVVALDDQGFARDITSEDYAKADEAVARRQSAVLASPMSLVLPFMPIHPALSLDPMEVIFELSDFDTLCNLSLADEQLAALFAEWFSFRVRVGVSRFIPERLRTQYHTVFNTTEAGITGSVATHLICTNILFPPRCLPRNLNIATPAGTLAEWEHLLTTAGAVRTRAFMRECFKDAVQCFLRFKLRSDDGRELVITISESRTESLLPVMLASELSSQMVLTTASYTTCSYLKHTANLSSVVVFQAETDNPSAVFDLRGFTVRNSMHSANVQCADLCGYIWRRTSEDLAVAQVAPDGSEAVARMKAQDFKWRLGRSCINELCPNYFLGGR